MAGRLPRTLIASVAAAALLVLPAGAQGEAFKPNKKSDHAPNGCTKKDCTLREAVIDANATPEKDSITLSKGKPWKVKRTGTNEDAAADGDLDVTADLKVRGKPKATVAGATEEAVFRSPPRSTAALKIKKLKVTGGATQRRLRLGRQPRHQVLDDHEERQRRHHRRWSRRQRAGDRDDLPLHDHEEQVGQRAAGSRPAA